VEELREILGRYRTRIVGRNEGQGDADGFGNIGFGESIILERLGGVENPAQLVEALKS
jgi:hypothetical protein